MSTSSAPIQFQQSQFTIRKKFFRVFGAGFQVFGSDGEVVLFSEQKAFKLKEDIRIFADPEYREEVLSIQARSWLDFSAAYDVTDPGSGQILGTFKRKGFSSFVRDQWILMDGQGNDVGLIEEDNAALAIVRRLVPYADLIPQSFSMTLQGQPVCDLRQHFNPIIQRLTVDFSADPSGTLDRRLGLAAGVLICAIEGRQDGGLLGG
ncbi:MAG: hypothetical protein ACKVVP_11670 [Chloroflexota bacterium]